MKRSEKLYGGAVFLTLLVAVTADSPNIGLWTGIALVGVVGTTLMVRAGRIAERSGK